MPSNFDPYEDSTPAPYGGTAYAPRKRAKKLPNFNDPNFDVDTAVEEYTAPDEIERHAKAKYYADRGFEPVQDSAGQVVPRGVKFGEGGQVDYEKLGEMDAQIAQTPKLSDQMKFQRFAAAQDRKAAAEAKRQQRIQNRLLAQEADLPRLELSRARGENAAAVQVARAHAKALKQFDAGPDGAALGTLQGQMQRDVAKAPEKLGMIRAAFDFNRETGDSTPEAEESQKRIEANKDRLEDLTEKRARLEQPAKQAAAIASGKTKTFQALNSARVGIPMDEPATGELAVDPEDKPLSTRPDVELAENPQLAESGLPTPASLIRMKKKAEELQATLDDSGKNLAEPVRTRLGLQVEAMRKGFQYGFSKQSPAFQKRISDLTRDPTLLENIGGAAVNVGKGIANTALDAGEFTARNALKLGALANPTTAGAQLAGLDPTAEAQAGVKDFAQAMRDEGEAWNNWLPENARQKVNDGFWTGSVASGVGSTLGFIGPTAVVGGIGKVAGLSEKAINALMTASVATSGAASEANNFRHEAEQHLAPKVASGEITQDDADRTLGMAEVLGVATGSTEAFTGISRMARRISQVPAGRSFLRTLFEQAGKGGVGNAARWLRGPGAKAAVDVASEMLEESGQEFGQNLTEDIFSKQTFDPNREVGPGASDAAGSAAASTAIVSLFSQALGLPRSTRRYKALGESVNRGAEARRNGGGPAGEAGAAGVPTTPGGPTPIGAGLVQDPNGTVRPADSETDVSGQMDDDLRATIKLDAEEAQRAEAGAPREAAAPVVPVEELAAEAAQTGKDAEIEKLLAQGYSPAEVAAQVGTPLATVHAVRAARGIPSSEDPTALEEWRNAQLEKPDTPTPVPNEDEKIPAPPVAPDSAVAEVKAAPVEIATLDVEREAPADEIAPVESVAPKAEEPQPLEERLAYLDEQLAAREITPAEHRQLVAEATQQEPAPVAGEAVPVEPVDIGDRSGRPQGADEEAIVDQMRKDAGLPPRKPKEETSNANPEPSPVETTGDETPGTSAQVAEGNAAEVQQPPEARSESPGEEASGDVRSAVKPVQTIVGPTDSGTEVRIFPSTDPAEPGFNAVMVDQESGGVIGTTIGHESLSKARIAARRMLNGKDVAPTEAPAAEPAAPVGTYAKLKAIQEKRTPAEPEATPTSPGVAPAPEEKPFALGSATIEQQAQEAEVKRAKDAAQKQRDEIAARSEKPLVGDSSNVGQGALLAEDSDLFSGPSLEEMAKKDSKGEEIQMSTNRSDQSDVDSASPKTFTFRDVNDGELPTGVSDALSDGEAGVNRVRAIDGKPPVKLHAVELADSGEMALPVSPNEGAARSDNQQSVLSEENPGGGGGQQVEGEAAKAIRPDVGNRMAAQVKGATLRRQLELVFGKRITFFRSSEPIDQDAITSPSRANQIFVNADTSRPWMALTGHEFTHNLKEQTPHLYRQLAEFIDRTNPMPEDFADLKRAQKYEEHQLHDEWVSDIVGQRFTEPEFWQEARRVAEERGKLPAFKRLAQAALDWLAKIARRMSNALHDLVKANALKDIELLRTQIAETMHDYAAGAPEGGYQENPGLSRGVTDASMSTPVPPEPPQPPKRKNENVPDRPGWFYRQGPDTERLAGLPVVRQMYERRGQKTDLELAKAVIDEIGVQDAAKLALDPNTGMDSVTREALIVETMQQAAKDAQAATGAEKAKLLRLIQNISSEHAPDLTTLGQTISMRQNLTKLDNAAGVIDQAVRDVTNAQNRELGGKEKAEGDLKDVADALNEAQAEGIEAATERLNKALRTVKVGKGIWQKYREAAAAELLAFAQGRTDAPAKRAPIQQFVKNLTAELRSRIAESIPDKNADAKPEVTPPMQIIKDALANPEKYKEAWTTVRDKLAEKYGEDSPEMQTIDLAMANIDAKPYGKKVLDQAIKEAHAQLGTTTAAIAKEHWTNARRINRDLAEALVDGAGLKAADAARVAADLTNRLNEQTKAAKDKALARLEKKHGATKKTREIIGAAKKAVLLNNLGALSVPELRNAVAKELNLRVLTDAEAAKLAELADKAATAPNDMAKARAELAVLKQMKVYKGSSAIDLLTSFWYANALSSPATHIANTVGNTVGAMFQTGSMMAANPKRVGDAMDGFLHGLKVGLTDARSMMTTGQGLRDFEDKVGGIEGAGQTLEQADVKRDLPKWVPGKPLIQLNANLLRYVGRAMRAMDSVFFHAAKDAYLNVATAKLLAAQYHGKELRAKVRDTLSISPDAWNAAQKQAESEGWKGSDLTLRVAGLLQKARAEVIGQAAGAQAESIMNAGSLFGAQSTLNQQPEGIAGIVYQGMAHVAEHARVGNVPVMKPFMMFLKVPANLFNNSLNLSPVGAMRAWRGSARVAADVGTPGAKAESRQYDADERARMYAQSVIGSSLMGLIAAAALGGGDDDRERNFDITAQGPDDFNHAQQLQQTGWRPYSIKVGNHWFSYRDLPMLAPLAVIGHVVDAKRYRKPDEKDLGKRLMKAILSSPASIFDTSMLQGLGTLGQWIQGKTTADQAATFFSRQAVGMQPFVPATNLISAIDRAFDPTVRNNDAPGGAMTASVPFARRAGSPKLDVLGQTSQRSPLDRFASAETNDLVREMLRDKRVFISTPSKTTMIGKVPMTPEQYRAYVGMRGEGIMRRLAPMVGQLQNFEPEKVEDIVERIEREEAMRAKDRVRRNLTFEPSDSVAGGR